MKKKGWLIGLLITGIVLSLIGMIIGIVQITKASGEKVIINKQSQMIIEEDGSIRASSKDEAYDYLREHGEELGLENIDETLSFQEETEAIDEIYYSYNQIYKGIPVFGRKIIVITNKKQGIIQTSSNYIKITKEISTVPTISQSDIQKAVESYMRDVYQFENISDIKMEGCDDSHLTIYSLGKEEEEHLAYLLTVTFNHDSKNENFTLLVDAHEANVLSASDNIYTERVKTEAKGLDNKEKTVYTWKNSENEYLLWDDICSTQIFDANKKITNVLDMPFQGVEPTQMLSYFSNNVTEEKSKNNKWNKKSITLLNSMELIYDWYLKELGLVGWNRNGGLFAAIYDDGYDNGNNAYSLTGYNKETKERSCFSVLAFGYNMDLLNIDLIAHEYSHSVQNGATLLQYQGETGAIMEGYADTMGEILEEDIVKNQYKNKTLSEKDKTVIEEAEKWYASVGRDIENPYNVKYPEQVNDKYFFNTNDLSYDNGGVHKNSTVISHMTYLMSVGIDGTESRKMNNQQIACLWYKTLMSNTVYDLDFTGLKSIMCATAKRMYLKGELSKEQYDCVHQVFSEVGIVSEGAMLINKEGTIQFLDIYMDDLVNADVTLYKITNDGHVNKKPFKNYETDSYGKITLDVPEGEYKLVIHDKMNKDTTSDEIVYISCVHERNDAMLISTNMREGLVKDFVTNQKEMTISINEKKVVDYTLRPVAAKNYTISWTSDDESIATVNQEGIVRGIKQGDTKIHAKLTSGENTFSVSVDVYVVDNMRDTILVLDTSGSMQGEPLEELKKSAVTFCEDLLSGEQNNQIEIIAFDEDAICTGFVSDLDYLKTFIEELDAGLRTNMYDALQIAYDDIVLRTREGATKNVVIMADGIPNKGEVRSSGIMTEFVQNEQLFFDGYGEYAEYGNAVCEVAERMMEVCNVYSLGFFHNLYDDDKKLCAGLMERIQNKGYYEVDDASKLQLSFSDVSNTISDGSKIVIYIACPVDVTVTYNGETLSSKPMDFNAGASFGELGLSGVNNDIKTLTLDAKDDYNIELTGTSFGSMDYSIFSYDLNDKLVDERNYYQVPLTANTCITTTTNLKEDINLNIDQDGNGETDIIWTAAKNGEGKETWHSNAKSDEETSIEQANNEDNKEKRGTSHSKIGWIILIIISAIIMLLCIIFLVVVIKMKKRVEQVAENGIDRRDTVISDNAKGGNTRMDNNGAKNINARNESAIDADIKKEIFENANSVKTNTSKVMKVKPGFLLIENGPDRGMKIPVYGNEEVFIGKDPKKVSIVTPKEFIHVSRVHCAIRYDDNNKQYYLTDFSSNGTYVNGIKVPSNQMILVEKETQVMLSKDGFCFRIM